MPTYTYLCEVCDKTTDVVKRMNEPHSQAVHCNYCGCRAVRTWGTIQVRKEFLPYVTANITGKPVEITSPRQRDALCAQSGVIPSEPGLKAKKQEPELKPFREDAEMIGEAIKNKKIGVEGLAAQLGEKV